MNLARRWSKICCSFVLLSSLFIVNVSSSYMPPSILSGGYGNSGGGGGSSSSLGGFGSSFGGGGQSTSQGAQGPVTTAIESTRTVEVKPIQIMNEPHEPQVVEVPSEDMPVTVHFKSQSSRVLVQQTHSPAQIGEPEHTTSEDEPQRVIHEVVKPVIQEIREIIQPYRRLIQQVQPVIEQTHTVIAKGEPRPAVEPISVEGASPGTLSGVGGGRGGGGGGGSGAKFGGMGGGGSKYGGSGSSYASAASSVSLKQASPPQQSPSSSELVGERKSSTVRNSPQSASYSLQPVAKTSSAASAQKYGQHQQQLLMKQQYGSSANNAYASRRGDFREPQQMEKFDKPKMSLRPAPSSMNIRPTQTRVSLKGQDSIEPQTSSSYSMRSISESMPPLPPPRPISETYPSQVQPQQLQQQPRIEPRFDEQPASAMIPIPSSSYSHQGFSMPYHQNENLAPLITFVAQPVRFRARA